jgi:hypothetical protein
MKRTTAFFYIGLLAVLIVATACTKSATSPANVQPSPSTAGNTPAAATDNSGAVASADSSAVAIDPAADIINDTPADPGTLDDINVSDEIPQ